MAVEREQIASAGRAQAALSRAIATLLTYWHREGVDDPAFAQRLVRMEEAWEALADVDEACRCDPPGSGEEWCTGHCDARAEEREHD
jgi:hypothetical protein